jgi:Glycosyltransferase
MRAIRSGMFRQEPDACVMGASKPPRFKVLQVLYSLKIGGAETFIINIDKNLKHDEVDFEYLVFKRVSEGYEDYVAGRGGVLGCVPTVRESGNPWKFVAHIRDYIEANGPYDAIHIHTDAWGFLPVIAAHRAGIKTIVCHSHTARYADEVPFSDKVLLAVHRFFLKKLHARAIACGKEAGDSMYGQLPYVVINNGINTADFEAVTPGDISSLRKELGIGSGKVVVHVGRFDDAKNQRFVIDLAEALHGRGVDCCFVLVGDGVLRESLKKRVEGSGSGSFIVMPGVRKDIPAILEMGSVFVFPSKYEGFPVSLVEAQCAGLPCVVSNAITSDADLGIVPYKECELDVSLWADVVEGFFDCPKRSLSETVRAVDDLGYGAKGNVAKLLKVYGINISGASDAPLL